MSRKQICATAKLFHLFSCLCRHDQAAVEKGFSVNNKVLNFNMHEISVTSRKLIIDHKKSQSFATVILKQKESVEVSEMFLTKIPRVLKRERIYTETKCTERSVSDH